jgi:hypothetical protein
MLDEYEVLIGGAKIDKQNGEWMTMKNSLCMDGGQSDGYDRMVGNVPELTELKDRSGSDTSYTMYVPLNFWFCNSYSQALPIIALQYHDVRFSFDFRKASDLVCVEGDCKVTATMHDTSLLIDYVLLDTQERKLFATQPHEMLIEQLQYPSSEPFNSTTSKVRLTLNHPCKHVTWGIKLNKWTTGKKFLAYHPTDYTATKKRAAELLFLLSLDVTKDDDGWNVKGSNDGGWDPDGGDTEHKWAQRDFSTNDLLKDFMTKVMPKTLIVTSGADNKLTADFMAEPFSKIEFLDKDILNHPALDAIVGTPVDEMKVTGGLYSALSKFFVTVNMYDNFGQNFDGSRNTVSDAVIQINGQDRFAVRDGNYFNYVQPYQHWPNTPADGINSYSFALKPSEYQPSGTLNFSRVDYATLNVTGDWGKEVPTAQLGYYTVNYNILRVLGGMGGLAYSN